MGRQLNNKTIKRKQGDVFEQLAVDKLKQAGYEIILTNFTTHLLVRLILSPDSLWSNRTVWCSQDFVRYLLKCVAEQVLCMVQRLRVLPQKSRQKSTEQQNDF